MNNFARHSVRTFLAWLTGAVMAIAASAAAAQPLLESRMQKFRDGSLKGFALAEYSPERGDIYSDQDFKDLAATGANVVRVFINVRKCDACRRYDDPDAEIRYVERVLRQGEALGFGVVVAMLPRPGYKKADFWDNPELMDDLVGHWRAIARRLRAAPALLAYDLMNEPVAASPLPALGAAKWDALARQMAAAVRAEDPNTPIMLEPSPWGLPGSFRGMKPLNLPGVVYSFHLYAPHEFTHQGLPGYEGVRGYPDGEWNRARLSAAMDEARAFAAATKSPMFVGEFSCVRWAPEGSCPRYLADAIALFEAAGWGWAYHCWRCYHGWDPEVPASAPQRPKEGRLPAFRTSDTPTMQLLSRALKSTGSPNKK